MKETDNNTETMSRREREKAAHRQEILDAATSVFAEKGFHSATLDEIAEKAEFSKGALYLYFPSKEDLLYSIMNETFDRWIERYFAIMEAKTTYREKLDAFLRGTAESVFEHPELCALMGHQHASLFNALSDEKQNELIESHDKIWTSFIELTNRAIADGELRDVCTEAIVGLVHGSIDSMIVSRWNCSTLESLNTAIDHVMDILLHGIINKEKT